MSLSAFVEKAIARVIALGVERKQRWPKAP